MKTNMSKVDKGLRLVVALIIAFLAYSEIISGVLAIILLALAIIFVITSFISFCPLYTLFGISTLKKNKN